jgi:hypothetical protein
MKADDGQPEALVPVNIGIGQGLSDIFQHVAVGQGAGVTHAF